MTTFFPFCKLKVLPPFLTSRLCSLKSFFASFCHSCCPKVQGLWQKGGSPWESYHLSILLCPKSPIYTFYCQLFESVDHHQCLDLTRGFPCLKVILLDSRTFTVGTGRIIDIWRCPTGRGLQYMNKLLLRLKNLLRWVAKSKRLFSLFKVHPTSCWRQKNAGIFAIKIPQMHKLSDLPFYGHFKAIFLLLTKYPLTVIQSTQFSKKDYSPIMNPSPQLLFTQKRHLITLAPFQNFVFQATLWAGSYLFKWHRLKSAAFILKPNSMPSFVSDETAFRFIHGDQRLLFHFG